MTFWLKISLPLMLCCCVTVQAQSTAIDRLEQTLAQQQRRSQEIESAWQRLQAQSDSLSRLIAPLKAQSPLTFFERRRLTALLADAQQISDRLEQTAAGRKEARRLQDVLSRRLDSLYTASLDSISLELKKPNGISPREKKRLLEQMALWQAKRFSLQSLAAPETTPVPSPLLVESDDLPEDIERKADYLRDRSDQLRSQAGRVGDRVHQVQKEIALRRRMADMVSDMRVFDSRDETARAGSTVDVVAPGRELETAMGNKAGYYPSTAFSLQPPAELLLNYDFRNLPAYSLDGYQELLEVEEQRLKRQADSLAVLARAFDQQAQQLRSTLIKQPQ